ncbi:MAG: cation diffusion facilitator family transporter [Hyphomicrobiaceae bacterium]
MPTGSNGGFVIYAALAGNCMVAITKFVAAFYTGSSAMLSEGIHSLVDTSNQGLLLYGRHRSHQPPDEAHPLGHGRELYFWSFIVALLLFALGAGLSFYEGIAHLRHPEPIRNFTVNYLVYAAAGVFEGISWTIAFREFSASLGDDGYFTAFVRSKDPPTFIVLVEDTAALLGIAVAAAATGLAQWLALPWLDGAASIAIAALLATTATLLARECKGLLIGETASREVTTDLRELAISQPAILKVNDIIAIHLSPDDVIVALSAEFEDALRTPEIERGVSELQCRMRARHPQVTHLFVKPQSRGS